MEYPEQSDLIAFIKGELEDEKRVAIRNWISSSPEHQKYFEKTRDIWDHHGQKAEAYQPDLEAAWSHVDVRINSKGNTWQWVYRVAAALVIISGLSYFFIQKETSQTNAVAALVEHQTTSTIEDLTLPDGTVITLNKGASLTYDQSFDATIRLVKLQGEAFFDVARDEDRPFVIETKHTKTEILGTSFSISETGQETILNVVSGKVAFSGAEKEPIFLTKGNRGTLTESGELVKSQNDDRNFMSWKTGELIFENDPLSTVLQHLDRHFEVTFQSEVEGSPTLTARFKNQPLEEILVIISGTLEIEIEATDHNNYTVK